MRTNIEIDEEVIAKVMAVLGAKTKEAVDRSLRRVLDGERQLAALRALRGSVADWEGDLDAMRRDA